MKPDGRFEEPAESAGPRRTRRVRTAAAVLLATLLSSAGIAEGQRDRPGPERGTSILRGQVVGADTGLPIRDAVVLLRSLAGELAAAARVYQVTADGGAFRMEFSGPSARVDDEGRFEFRELPAGRYRLVVMPGTGAARYRQRTYPDALADELEPLAIESGRSIDAGRIALPRAGAINGRIVDALGAPLATATVTAVAVLPGNRRAPHGVLYAGLSDTTDDNGMFRLFGLEPGDYVLLARPRLSPTAVLGSIGTFRPPIAAATAPVYYPGTLSPAEAGRIRVDEAQEVGPIEFGLPSVRPLTIRGVLLDAGGDPLPGMAIQLIQSTEAPPWGPSPVSAKANTDGTFELSGAPPGEHLISVYRYGDGGARGPQYGLVRLTLVDDMDGLVVRLQPVVSIQGQVAFEGTAPQSFSGLHVQAVPAIEIPGRGYSGVQLQPNRTFAIDNQYGPILIRASGLPGWHVKSVIYAGRDVTDLPMEYDGRSPVQVVLSQESSTIAGRVTTAKGLAVEAGVIAFGEDPALWRENATTTRTVPSNAAGDYKLTGLRAGRYFVIAVPLADSAIAKAGPAFFELLSRQAALVTVGDGESKSLDLKVVPLR